MALIGIDDINSLSTTLDAILLLLVTSAELPIIAAKTPRPEAWAADP
jgi:hypothetical protein